MRPSRGSALAPYFKTHGSSRQLGRLIPSLEGEAPLSAFPLRPVAKPPGSRRERGPRLAPLLCSVCQAECRVSVVADGVVKHSMFFILTMDEARELGRDCVCCDFAYLRKRLSSFHMCVFPPPGRAVSAQSCCPVLRGGGGGPWS